MSQLILHLPKYCQLLFISEWFELKEIAKVDTSFCNREERKQFLTHLRNTIFMGDIQIHLACCVTWINQRKIKLKVLQVNDIVLSLYQSFDASRIRSLKIIHHCIGQYSGIYCLNLINKCLNLSHLEFEHFSFFNHENLRKVSSVILKQINHLIIIPAQIDALTLVGEACEQLKTLQFQITNADFKIDDVLLMICKKNENLTKLHINNVNENQHLTFSSITVEHIIII
jgi:hypothetical protein